MLYCYLCCIKLEFLLVFTDFCAEIIFFSLIILVRVIAENTTRTRNILLLSKKKLFIFFLCRADCYAALI